MKRSENIVEFSKALNMAQKEMRPACKDSTNPHFKSKYSDLAAIMDAIRDPVANAGLSILQEATVDDKGVNVSTTLLHLSGQWIEFEPLTIPLGKRDAHAVGSAITYGKRYSLCAALGVVSDEDDDGNKAVDSYKKYPMKPEPRKPNHIEDNFEFVDNAPKKVSEEEWKEFNIMLTKCDKDYQNNVWTFFQSKKISSFGDVDFKIFHRIKERTQQQLQKASA